MRCSAKQLDAPQSGERLWCAVACPTPAHSSYRKPAVLMPALSLAYLPRKIGTCIVCSDCMWHASRVSLNGSKKEGLVVKTFTPRLITCRSSSELAGLWPDPKALRFGKQQVNGEWVTWLGSEDVVLGVQANAGLLLPWGRDYWSRVTNISER